jgi:hypothetical protein
MGKRAPRINRDRIGNSADRYSYQLVKNFYYSEIEAIIKLLKSQEAF